MFAFWYYSTSWLTLVALTLYSLATTEPERDRCGVRVRQPESRVTTLPVPMSPRLIVSQAPARLVAVALRSPSSAQVDPLR